MSFINLGKIKQNYWILDTEDLVSDSFDEKELRNIINSGVFIESFDRSSFHIGLKADNNNYSLYINDYAKPVFTGSFPTCSSRNDLFSLDIRLGDYGIYNGNLVVVLFCNCWCKWDIELPMVMCQVVAFSIKDILSTGRVICLTKEPVYFCNRDFFILQNEQCCGDFPDYCVDRENLTCSISKKGLEVFGVVYSHLPAYEFLEDRLPRLIP